MLEIAATILNTRFISFFFIKNTSPVYKVFENVPYVVGSDLYIQRNIAKLEHCKCWDSCSNEETCKCSDMWVRSWST